MDGPSRPSAAGIPDSYRAPPRTTSIAATGVPAPLREQCWRHLAWAFVGDRSRWGREVLPLGRLPRRSEVTHAARCLYHPATVWPFDSDTANSLQAVGSILSVGLLIVLAIFTKGYADSTAKLARDTQGLAEQTAASVEMTRAERRARRTGLLRAVAGEVQVIGSIARHMREGGDMPRLPSKAVLDRHHVELASSVPYPVYYETWVFADALQGATDLWGMHRALSEDERKDLALITDRVIRESEVIANMLIDAIEKEDVALAAAQRLSEERRADFEAYARLLEVRQRREQPPPSS